MMKIFQMEMFPGYHPQHGAIAFATLATAASLHAVKQDWVTRGKPH